MDIQGEIDTSTIKIRNVNIFMIYKETNNKEHRFERHYLLT